MPRHGTGLGAGNFPAANKLLMRYEADRAYRMHQQKIQNVKHRLDVAEPKKHNHLVLRLKQIQKEEDRQAEIDHENKLLLNKMTHVLKYGGNIDNWNNYESRSLNYPYRERQNEDIARENLSIARRLEGVKPKVEIPKWEREYQQHQYLKRLWNDSVKDFGEFTPRRYQSRMSKAVKRSVDNLNDTYDDISVDTADDRKLPKIKKRDHRPTKSETSAAPSTIKKDGPKPGAKGSNKLPKIVPHKAESAKIETKKKKKEYLWKSPSPSKETSSGALQEEKSEVANNADKSKTDKHKDNSKAGKQANNRDRIHGNSNPYKQESKANKVAVGEDHGDKVKSKSGNDKKQDNGKDNDKGNGTDGKTDDLSSNSQVSIQSSNYPHNNLERVKTLISEEKDNPDDDGVEKKPEESQEGSDCGGENKSDDKAELKDESKRRESGKESVNDTKKEMDEKEKKEADDSHDDFYDSVSETGQGDGGNEESTISGKAEQGIMVKDKDDGEIKKRDGDENDNKVTEKTKNDVDDNDGDNKSSSKGIGNKKLADNNEDNNINDDINENKDLEQAKVESNESSDEQNKVSAESSPTSHSENVTNDKEDGNSKTDDKGQESSINKDNASLKEGTKGKGDELDGSVDQNKNTKRAKSSKIAGKRNSDNKKEDGISGQAKEDDKSDVAQLFKVAKQLGRPEDIFIKTLIKKSHKQRMTTKSKFRQKYDLDLITELKNGLGPQWEYLIDALLQERGVADAYALFDALSTADLADIVELLSTRDNAAIAEMKDCYRKEFSISLEEDISDRTEVPIRTLLLTLQTGARDESTEVNDQEVTKEAKALFDCQDSDRWESESSLLMKLLTRRSYSHIQAVFLEYRTASGGSDITRDMKQDCNKDYYRLLHTLVHVLGTPGSFYAEKLAKHKLPSDPMMVGILVTRSEVDMPLIRKAYKKQYGVDLVEDLKGKTHPTVKCLIELANKVPPTGKKNDAKKTYVKDGAASQLHQPQKKPPAGANTSPAAGKRSEPKPKVHVAEKNASEATTSSKTDQHATQKKAGAGESKQPAGKASKTDNTANDKSKSKESTTSNRGTVKAASGFNVDEDCGRIKSALEAGDDRAVIAIVAKRSNAQRQQLRNAYEQKYKKNLLIDLEDVLPGETNEIVLAVMTPSHEYDAYILHEAVEGLGTSEASMIAVLTTRSQKELKAIKDHYQKAFKSDMEKDITRDCGEGLRTLLVALSRGGRSQTSSVDMPQAQTDAKTLHEDGVPGEAFTELLVKQNHFQVKATFEAYKKVSGEDIYSALSKSSLGDDAETVICIAKAIEDPVLFYAENIHGCFGSMGVNENMLIRLTVPRAEVDLADIKERYQEKFSRSLYDTINGQSSGDYKPMLLAIVDNSDEKPKQQGQGQPKKKATQGPKPTDPKNKDLGGTVKPAKPFNPIVDSERIHEALSGIGTDEEVLVEILPHRTNDQRQEIKAKYQDKYNKDLQNALESELRGDFEEIVLGMMMKPAEYDAYCLHEAMKGLGTNEAILVAILGSRTGQELSQIKSIYKEVYGKDLQTQVTQDVSGGMEDLFVEILKCQRQQGESVDLQMAKNDAYTLYKDGQISIDPQDEVFKDIIAKKSRAQVRATFKEFKKLSGNDIYYGIEKALVGDDEDAYLALAKAVEDPVLFYTESLHDCFEGLGTNDTRVIRIIVARSEIDLEDIKVRYNNKYKTRLRDAVKAECDGDYMDMLLAILGQ